MRGRRSRGAVATVSPGSGRSSSSLRRSWRETVKGRRIDLLLVEIAGGEIAGWGAERSGALAPLLSWARGVNVPVVVWVTGGSADADLADAWIGSATQAFLDREEVLDMWRPRWPPAAIDILGPAAQPRLHNPRTGGAGRRRKAAAAVVIHGKSVTLDALAILACDNLDLWS